MEHTGGGKRGTGASGNAFEPQPFDLTVRCVHRRKLLLAPLLCCRVTSVGRRVRRHHRLRVVPDYEQNRTPLLFVVAFESPLLQSIFSFSWARLESGTRVQGFEVLSRELEWYPP